MPLIVIDGLIGAGKSTAIEVIRERLVSAGAQVVVIREPLDLWLERGRLQQFYEALGRRSYQFQTMAFHTRITEMRRAFKSISEGDPIILMERSIFSDRIFAQILFEQGNMDQTEMEDYEDLWQMWRELMPRYPDHFIFLRPCLETVVARQTARAREGETVSTDYQELLLKRTDAFYDKPDMALADTHTARLSVLATDYDYRDSEEGKDRLVAEFCQATGVTPPQPVQATT